jgi:hypothetical protein
MLSLPHPPPPRYADRAKQIKNKAIINIDPTELLISKLKEDNAKLMAQLKAFTDGGDIDFAALMAAGGGGAEGGAGKPMVRVPGMCAMMLG